MSSQKFPSFLEDAFTEGYSRKDTEDDVYTFFTKNIGALKVKTGKIIACDPLCMYIEDPFTVDFPIGDFPVELAIAVINDDDQRNGLARIRFSNQKPVKWEDALTEGQNKEDLGKDEFFGYGVDSGTGSFMDVSGFEEYEELYKDEEEFSKISEHMELNYKDTRSWLLWEGENGNGAIFSSGYGDGTYGTYIGYDAAGNICRLVTDFGLLEW